MVFMHREKQNATRGSQNVPRRLQKHAAKAWGVATEMACLGWPLRALEPLGGCGGLPEKTLKCTGGGFYYWEVLTSLGGAINL